MTVKNSIPDPSARPQARAQYRDSICCSSGWPTDKKIPFTLILSVAADSIDGQILSSHLQEPAGVNGNTLKWLRPFLSD